MAVNADKPTQWKTDIAKSVDMYNDWFMLFAPITFRQTRIRTTADVEQTLKTTENLASISIALLEAHPGVLPTLRMCTCPPIAVDRLIGLAGVSDSLVGCMERGVLPKRMLPGERAAHLVKIIATIQKLADPDIFVWLGRITPATEAEQHRAATIVADRLCGAFSNPIIRNEQERRQLAALRQWLLARGYNELPTGANVYFRAIAPGTFAFRMVVPVRQEGGNKTISMPVDAVIMPHTAKPGDLPLLFEAKSAGDFANVNKRRKEEATKVNQLRNTYGDKVSFNLLLCGYFGTPYLGYEAAEGIDWVWEHRLDDMAAFGI